MRVRRAIAAVLAAGAVAVLPSQRAGAEVPRPALPAPAVAGRAAVLLEADNGQVLFASNPDEPLPVASTTKIMTALIAVEKGNPDDLVTVSRRASRMTGSRVYLDEGERQTLRDLLYALMLESGNDAAVAIAEHIAGSVEGFAVLMNERARELGAAGTRFRNPHGLPAEGHRSTARDLAQITREALKHPLLAEIVTTRSHRIPWPAKSSVKDLHNHNRLLYQGIETADARVVGVKTGYTSEAGYCLVAAADRGGRTLIAVILGSQVGQVYADARRLLDYGFAAYETRELVRAGEQVGTAVVRDGREVPLVAARGLKYSFPRGSAAAGVSRRVDVAPSLAAPIRAGEPVGVARLVWEGRELGMVPVMAAQTLESEGRRLFRWWWLSLVMVLLSVWLGKSGGRRRGSRWRRRRSRRGRYYVYTSNYLRKE